MSARGGTPSDRPTPATEIGTRRSKSPFCCVATTRAFDASSPTSSRRALAGTRSSLAHVLRASGAHSSRAPSLGNSPRYCYRSVPRRLPFRDRYCSAPAAAAATAPRPFSDRFHSATVLQPQPLLLRSAAATTTAPFRGRYHYRSVPRPLPLPLRYSSAPQPFRDSYRSATAPATAAAKPLRARSSRAASGPTATALPFAEDHGTTKS
jgi:hypothetical protein